MAAKGSQTEESRNVARTGSAPARMAARARLSGVGSKQGSRLPPPIRAAAIAHVSAWGG